MIFWADSLPTALLYITLLLTDRLLQLWAPMGRRCVGLLQIDYYVGLALDEILASFPGPEPAYVSPSYFICFISVISYVPCTCECCSGLSINMFRV
jgi:hypothetical protein